MPEADDAAFVVYTDIVGDLFHAGHVRFLRLAREAAAERAGPRPVRLVVGVMSDELVQSYKRRPVLTSQERVEIIAACRFVDDVVPDAPAPVDGAFLDRHGIDLVVHGDDMPDAELRHWYGTPIARGAFVTVPYTTRIGEAEVSTSALIRRILDAFGSAGR